MTAVYGVLTDSPALIVGIVVAVVALLGTFGVPLTDAQAKAIVGLATAFVALAGAIVVHRSTTPNRTVDTIVRTVTSGQDPTTPPPQ